MSERVCVSERERGTVEWVKERVMQLQGTKDERVSLGCVECCTGRGLQMCLAAVEACPPWLLLVLVTSLSHSHTCIYVCVSLAQLIASCMSVSLSCPPPTNQPPNRPLTHNRHW